MVYFSRELHSTDPGGRLNFINFETDKIDSCLEFIQELKVKQQNLYGSKPGELCVMATGGGAYKYYDKMKEVLGVPILREDEMECLIMGVYFLGDCFGQRLLEIYISLKFTRARFLHYGNPKRSLHIQRDGSHAFC